MNAPKFLSSGDSAITVEFGNEISAEINACVHALDKALRKKTFSVLSRLFRRFGRFL